MNNRINNNFLEEEIEYEEVPEDEVSPTDEILEEIDEDYAGQLKQNQQTNSVLAEAIKRIEQAKLYEALLNHDLFAPGSARPEIIKAVRKEFKDFILLRLEVLLGIKQSSEQGTPEPTTSQFDQTEVSALKGIAQKLIARDSQASNNPSVNTVAVPQPKVNKLQTKTAPVINPVEVQEPELTQNTVVAKKMVKRVVRRTNPDQSQVSQPKRRQRSQNVSVHTGQDLSQATNPARPPVAMPSQSQMDMMNAKQADSNARATAQTSGALAKAITTVLKG
jgi:hypothetical protein